MIDLLEIQIATIERDLRPLARRQAGCQALMTQYGMGEISALVHPVRARGRHAAARFAPSRPDGRDRHGGIKLHLL
jgi:hypothetical protein